MFLCVWVPDPNYPNDPLTRRESTSAVNSGYRLLSRGNT